MTARELPLLPPTDGVAWRFDPLRLRYTVEFHGWHLKAWQNTDFWASGPTEWLWEARQAERGAGGPAPDRDHAQTAAIQAVLRWEATGR